MSSVPPQDLSTRNGSGPHGSTQDHQHPETPARRGLLPRVWGTCWAILRQRCPRCRRGRIFRGSLAMNDPCPVCGLLFQREEGYFLSALYFSYILSTAALLTFYFVVAALFPNWNGYVVALAAIVLYLPFIPLVFRSSRVLWIYYDRTADPHGHLSGPYERQRLKQHPFSQGSPPGEHPS
ncbi:MAG: DUF983 domain-containing protein [Planctomycetes bacterium]|nr:DUF983 domain-containing protein [Planctomycetota bacterium]